MNLERFVQRRSADWLELETLLLNTGGRARLLKVSGVRRMFALYRAAAADLAYARREFPGEPEVLRLDDLVRRASQTVYGGVRTKRWNPLTWLTTGLWRCIAERPLAVLVCVLALMGPFVLSAVWANLDPVNASVLAPAGTESVVQRESANFQLSPEEKAAVSAQIFTNNIQIAFLVFVAGIAAGIGSIAMLMYQGVVLGAIFGLTIQAGNSAVLWQFVVPHGFLELSCIIVAGVAGLRLGWTLVDPGYRSRAQALREESLAAVQIVLGVALTLLLCGIFEGSISTAGLPTPLGITVGVLLAGLFWTLVVVRGRIGRGQQAVGSDSVSALGV
ncbi:MAG: stage II sporulation protein M [Acidimicrobiia bacterium]